MAQVRGVSGDGNCGVPDHPQMGRFVKRLGSLMSRPTRLVERGTTDRAASAVRNVAAGKHSRGSTGEKWCVVQAAPGGSMVDAGGGWRAARTSRGPQGC